MVGWFGIEGREVPAQRLRAALERMRRRGPDDEGEWSEGSAYIGHRRLAILDLDHRAAQPMRSSCGRYVIAFNGEIYNFRELRKDLERRGVAFRTTSDTEVILALYAVEGEAMLSKLHGMFAMIIWDRVDKRAFVARDPYGIKPLYVAQTAGGVVVASQVRAIISCGLASSQPDMRAQADFWMLGSVPEPRTWFADIQAVPSGNHAYIIEGRLQGSNPWFDIGASWRDAETGGGDDDVRSRVRSSMCDSVARHCVSDVPVGVFLSGGVDSGVLAGMMVEAGAREVLGVTLAYDEFKGGPEDEVPRARSIASHFGLKHAVRRVTADEFKADLPRILEAMDQPSVDGINTWYASKAAAELGLKVVLSGVGGDELFQGYSSFQQLPSLVSVRKALGVVPGARAAIRTFGRVRARQSANRRWQHIDEWSSTIEGAWWLRRSICAPEDLGHVMGEDAAEFLLRDFDVVARVREMTGALACDLRLALGQIESMVYLRNQLLRDSDWASMDHSVELRTPLVDAHLLVTLTPYLRTFGHRRGKQLLAQCPAHGLPAAISMHRKTGFGIPAVQWGTRDGTASARRLAMLRMVAEGYLAS